MTQKLTKMQIDRIDLVDKGANGRQFALFKRAGAASAVEAPASFSEGLAEGEEHVKGLAARIGEAVAKVLRIPEPVEKAMTFAQIVAGEEMSQALEEHWTTLQSALWGAIYAYDEDNQPLPTETKKALVAQNLDEFKAFLLERMDQGVTKSDGSADVRLFEAFIAKVGKKVSAARLSRLKEAADALAAVLAEVEADNESAKTEKRATPQEEDMTTEELVAAFTKANEPLVERIEALEKASKPAEPVVKGEGDEGEGDEPVTNEAIAEAITKLADRVEAIEKRPGQRQSAAGEETVTKKDAGVFAGIL